MRALSAAARVLERRLDPNSRAPVVAAFSGGGDSLALLLAARAFAERRGRPLVAIHVDHGLQPQSGVWAADAEAVARRLGAHFVLRRWTGPKPATGLPAAARAARHRLIAEACRELGATVALIGHTFDDQLENALMRGAGAPVGALREWSPSPVWPEGRDLFLCRPLLSARRTDLRSWLAAEGLAWLDDPANDDWRYARARARRALADGAAAEPCPDPDLRSLAGLCRATPWGGVVIERAGLLTAKPEPALRLLQIAVACVSGAEGLARPGRARGLMSRLAGGETFVAGLGGARIEAGALEVALEREAGEAARGGLQPVLVAPGRPEVWDGRFEAQVLHETVRIEALRGQLSRLGTKDRAEVVKVSVSARPVLPVFRTVDQKGAEARLVLTGSGAHIEDQNVRCRALCEARLAAAIGLVSSEAEIGTIARMANFSTPHYVGAGSKD